MRRRNARRPRRESWGPLLFTGAGLAAVLLVGVIVLWPRPQPVSQTTSPNPISLAVDPPTPGRLAAAAATVDLGRVPFDQTAEARYELVNTGGRDVRLVGKPTVKTLEGCWPVTPTVGSAVLRSSERTMVTYPFVMHQGMGGPHRFEITLQTDSPETPTLTLTLLAVAG